MSQTPSHNRGDEPDLGVDPKELDRAMRLWSNADDPDLEDLRAVQRRLDAEGEQYRDESVAASMAAGPVPGEDRAIAALEEAMGFSQKPLPAHRFRRRVAPVAAVAAGFMLIAAVRHLSSPAELDGHTQPGKPPLILSGNTNGFLIEPVGNVDTFGTFRWSEAPTRGATHEVCIWFGTAPSGAPDMTEEVYDDPQWLPSPEQLKTLNDQGTDIYWEVVEIDPIDQARDVLGSASVSLSR